jgi:hypothetical protein
VRRQAALIFLVLGAAVSACNSSHEFDGCDYAENPTGVSRVDKCPKSIFEPGTIPWRDINGVIWQGDNGVAGAVIAVDTRTGAPAQTISSANGYFGPIKDVAVNYDLTARVGKDVIAIRGMTTRYPAPSLDLPAHAPAAAWVKRINLQLAAPLPEGHAVAFFVTGGNSYGAVGDLEHGVSIVDKDYAGGVTIHAVEYEKGKDLSTASAYGKADAFVSAATPQLVSLRLDPITSFPETLVTASLPPGMSADTAEITINYSRSSSAVLTTMKLGEKRKLPLIPNVGSYAYRIRASSPDGATSDSGQQFLNVYAPETKAELVAPPVVDSPADGASMAVTDPLGAHAPGILEHVLVAEGGSPSIHVVAMNQSVRLPSFAAVGADVPHGKYTWVVRSFPKLDAVDQVGGQDARRYDPIGISAPRTIVFR